MWIHWRWSSSAFITCNSRWSSRMKNQIIIETFPSSWSSFGCGGAVQTKTGSIVSWVVKNRTPIYCLFDADLVLMIVDMIILKSEKLKHFFIFVTYNTWNFPPPVTQCNGVKFILQDHFTIRKIFYEMLSNATLYWIWWNNSWKSRGIKILLQKLLSQEKIEPCTDSVI